MTGFGSASRSRGGVSVTAEVRSVNNKYLKIGLRSPTSLSSREHEIEALIRESATRGTVNLTIRLVRKDRPVLVRMNEDAAREYLRLIRRLGKDTKLSGEPDLNLVAGLPGVFSAEEIEQDLSDDIWELVREVTALALEKMTRMRSREGAHLKRDFVKRAAEAARLTRSLANRAKSVPAEIVARLEERVRRLLENRGVSVSEADLLRELAILSERSDVTEEITRLTSHLDQFRKALNGKEAVGRRLEFLVQEMHREANTISSKSADVEMSRTCVDLKIEMDRLKEQVLNVE